MIDLFSLVLGAFLTAGIQLLVLLIAFTWRWINRRLDARETPATPDEGKPWVIPAPAAQEAASDQPGPPSIVPSFGQPELVEYDPEDYVEPLRCTSGVRCGGVPLTRGETFIRIPWVGDPQGRFLVICAEDIQLNVGEAPHG